MKEKKEFWAVGRRMLLLALLLCVFLQGMGQSRKKVDRSTDVLCLLPVAAGATVSLLEKDYKGLSSLALGEGVALAVNYGLELCIRKDRPDGSGHHAFPSTHTVVAFEAATFIGRRYGWKWSIPAYAVSTYVAFGRVYAKKHDVWDVVAGAAIGVGTGFLIIRKQKGGVAMSLLPTIEDGGGGVAFSATF